MQYVPPNADEATFRNAALAYAISIGTPPDDIISTAQKYLDFLRPVPATVTGIPDAK